MTNPNGAVTDKPDDLEITSIGSLYSGPWDKKYWSSSRGKDRYPYPIGYRALRAHNGSTYKMEIQEGPKGPLFLIVAADGQSFSGQTPDIAWEKLQKKCFPRTKIWHGKRFSCKIDGVEFFGFKNLFVQRLLRELAADIDGAAERSLLASSFCNGASSTDVDNRSPEAGLDQGRPKITGKRTRKCESGNRKSSSRTGIKRTRTEDLVSVSKALNPVEENKRHSNSGKPMSSSLNEEHVIPAPLPPFVHLVSVQQEENEISAKDCLPLDSAGFLNHLCKDSIPKESDGLGTCKSTPEDINKSMCERKFDTKMEAINFPMAPDDQKVDATFPKDCRGLTDVELYAPDTLDYTQDKTADASSTIQLFAPDTLDFTQVNNAGSSSTIQDRSALDVVIADGLLTESHPEDEMPNNKSNTSSQNFDFDSVGQEMAKSMMTFLLPQAIPLLNKHSRKKKGSGSPSKVLPCTVKSQKQINETTAPSPGLILAHEDATLEKIHSQCTDLGPIAPMKSIIPDSLDDDQYGDHVANHLISSCDKGEADQLNSDGAFPVNSHGGFVAANEHGHLLDAKKYDKSVDDQLETKGSKDAHLCEEVGRPSTGRDSKYGECIVESLCVSAHKKSFTEEIMEKSCIDECRVGTNINSKKMNDTAVDHSKAEDIVDDKESGMLSSSNISEKEISAKAEFTETGNMSFSHAPNLVYTRRKVQTKSHGKGSNSYPVSETKICKNKVSETYPSTETLQKTKLARMWLAMKTSYSSWTLEDLINRVAIEEQEVGQPSLVGYTSVILPDLTNFNGMTLERFCLQFIPDGECLVLLDRIKAPFCRQGKTNCLCTTCVSSCSEENAIKIVQVKHGYVSLVTRLKAVESQRCILVCEPNNLVSVGKSGRLHLWAVDSTWSAQVEYVVMPSEDCISPGIVDLKRIPNCTHLLVGHNGYGEFSLWDISKRILLSKFSAPSGSICQFFPIRLFAWQMNFPASSHLNMEEHVNQMMASTSKNLSSFEGEDVAVCLLVSTSDSDAQQDYELGNCHPNPVGKWRLALMVKNMVIFGAVSDSSASVIGTSAGQGICGTCDGLVYMWELSSGTKLGTMHHFKGGGVSCISNDDSGSGAVAIAGDNQVLVYMRSGKYSVN
ncbi:uncharacterized protein LOC126790971 isoform X3 [Argentina anserina]|uniref:uncharacterized protein LOC126790971 isoform X3 n=1 Tax=Argentina anserina TaxID=57926 RepID=UPI0021768D2E|nr:uncharacterized protein LOC126790971 isoform X3 [Potentilla anserina]